MTDSRSRAHPHDDAAHDAHAAVDALDALGGNANDTRPPTRRRSLGLLAAGTTATAVAAAFLLMRSAPVTAAAPTEPPPVPVSVAVVQARAVAPWQGYSGRLEAVDQVDLRPRVAGTVQAVHFREGDLVQKGELLFTIDPAPYAAEVARAEAAVAAAQARDDRAQADFKRSVLLMQDRAISQREHDERRQALSEADADLNAARAQLEVQRLNLSWTQVRAPISGRVGRVEVTVGNLVAAGPNAPVLARLVSVSPIYASFDVDERSVSRTLAALPAEAAAAGRGQALARVPVRLGVGEDGGFPVEGRLQLVDNQVDPATGTVRVRAVFDNTDRHLMPGQFARLQLGAAQSESALLVNERAVGTDQDKKFVLVVGADQRVAWREVSLGRAVDGLRIVERGLRPGEQVIVNGLQRVRPGMRVAPSVVPMAVTAQGAPESAPTRG